MFVELLMAVSVGAYVWVACWPIAQQTAAQIFIDDLPCADPGQVPYFRVSDAVFVPEQGRLTSGNILEFSPRGIAVALCRIACRLELRDNGRL